MLISKAKQQPAKPEASRYQEVVLQYCNKDPVLVSRAIMSLSNVYIMSAARTPIGEFLIDNICTQKLSIFHYYQLSFYMVCHVYIVAFMSYTYEQNLIWY